MELNEILKHGKTVELDTALGTLTVDGNMYYEHVEPPKIVSVRTYRFGDNGAECINEEFVR